MSAIFSFSIRFHCKKTIASKVDYKKTFRIRVEAVDKKKMAPVIVKKKAIEATPESFKGYGQVVGSSPDNPSSGRQDAELDLSQGTPRFFTMCLRNRKLEFTTIAHHARVTQCLGAIGGNVWYLGVAKSTIVDSKDSKERDGTKKSPHGHLYVPPSVDDVQVFRISGPKFIKLDKGTWHAGPLFDGGAIDFYTLQLEDTDEVDFTDYDFQKEKNVVIVAEE